MSTSDAQSKNARSRLYSPLSKVLMLALGAVAGMLLAEGLLRVLGAERGGVFTVSAEEFEQVPGIFEPGLEGVTVTDWGHSWRTSIDTLGYRGTNFPRRKPDGEYRVFFAGDSFAFGYLVNNDETLPAQLEVFLNQRCDTPIGVINGGLGGSTLTEQVPMILRGLAMEPDLVILQFHENDVRDLGGSVMWEDLARNREVKGNPPISLIYPVVRRSALWSLFSGTLSRIRSNAQPPGDENGNGRGNGDPEAQSRSLREEYERRLVDLKRKLVDQHVPLVLTAFPLHSSVSDPSESELLPWIERIANRHDIPLVSFTESLSDTRQPITDVYFVPNDGHATALGYELAAVALTESLISSGMLDARCS